MTAAPDIVSVVLRAAWFVLLFQSAGAALFIALFGSRLQQSAARIRRLGTVAAILAALFLLAHYLMEAARMAGDFSGVLDSSLQRLVLRSPTSEALVLRLAALGLVILSLQRSFARGAAVGLIGALLSALAFTLTGHTSVHSHRPLLAVLLLAHVLIGMFWFGSLLPLWLVSAREPRDVAGRVIESFSATAVWLVPLLLLAGLGLTVILVPGWVTFGQPYGALLIVKVTLFGGLMGLAAGNRSRFGPGILSGVPTAAPAFRNAVAAEAVLICIVLAVTACLTTFFSPE
jgi:putative copper export protein